MSTADSVQRLSRQYSEEALAQAAAQWAQATMQVCRDVISTVKKIIKNKKEPPVYRLMALKLFHLCMLKANPNFLSFASKKVMSRLTILAQHKKTSRDSDRGEDIFGAISTASPQSREASAEFLRCLLSYIRIWSQRFGRMQDGSQSIYALSYMKLMNFGVTFPPGDPPQVVFQSRSLPPSTSSPPGLSQPLTRQEIDTQSNSAQLLSSLLSNPRPDTEAMAQLHSQLSAFLLRIERELNMKTGREGLEDYISQLFELNDFVRGVVERYEKTKLAESPREGRNGVQAASHLEMELREKQQTLRNLEEELILAKREAADYYRSLDQRRLISLQLKSQLESEQSAQASRHALELRQKETESASSTGRNNAKYRLQTANSLLTDLKERLKQRENEHRSVLKAISAAQEENKRLRMQMNVEISSPVRGNYAPQEFVSQRGSLYPEVSVSSGKPAVSEVMLRPPDNKEFIPMALQRDRGLVFSDANIEIGFLFKSSRVDTMLLYIGNKGQSDIMGLQTTVYDLPSEGLELTISKETEEQSIAARNKVHRTLSVRKSGTFVSMPRMMISYQIMGRPQSHIVSLPITIIRYMTPQLAAGDSDLLTVWKRLESFSSEIVVSSPANRLCAPAGFETYLSRGALQGEDALFGMYEGQSLVAVLSQRNSLTVRCPLLPVREALLQVLYQTIKA